MKHPFFSIIIPTYNRCDLLGRALKSVINQKFKSFEIIIIDNYSKDKTKQVVNNLKKKNIIYKKIKNRGIISKSRNEGIKLSKGKWIAFLDSDDIWRNDKLEKIYKLIKTKKFEVICNNEWIINENSKKKKIWENGPFVKNFYKYLIEYETFISISGSIVKKSFLDKNKISFSEKKDFVTAEDLDFFLKIAQKGGVFYFLLLPLGCHFFHSKAESYDHLRLENARKAVLKHHIFKIQKFTNNKTKIWRKVNFYIIFKGLIVKLKNNKIRLNVIKKFFYIYLSNPLLSIIFSYKMIRKKIFGIYLTKKFL